MFLNIKSDFANDLTITASTIICPIPGNAFFTSLSHFLPKRDKAITSTVTAAITPRPAHKRSGSIWAITYKAKATCIIAMPNAWSTLIIALIANNFFVSEIILRTSPTHSTIAP